MYIGSCQWLQAWEDKEQLLNGYGGFYLGVMKIFEDKIEVVVAPHSECASCH